MMKSVVAWIRRLQNQLSDRIHENGDREAMHHGWEITKSTGRLGFGMRTIEAA